ncbi:hypothetical protein APHAL10511_008527 [Amanita phalloides]|nr:hypothetical protein APHAL10511_008527 [Amanita phalloides]
MSNLCKRKDPEGQKAGAPGTELAGVGQEAGASGMATTSSTATTQNFTEHSPPHKRFKGDAQYLQAWDEVMYARGDPTTEEWGQFYEKWWGSASTGKAHFEALHREGLPLKKRAILVGDARVQRGFNLLAHSKGWMIVRDEYATIYNRLSSLFEAEYSGAVLTGNPGIESHTLLRRSPEVSMLTDDAALFVLITSSPKEERYKEWMKQRLGLLWVMNPWSKEELRVLLSNPDFTKLSPDQIERYQSAEAVQKLMENVGPCPRDILKSIITPRAYKKDIEQAFTGFNSDKLIALFGELIDRPDSIPDQLALLRWAHDGNSLDSDEYLVEFKSEEICRRARKFLNKLALEDCIRLFATLSNVPAARILAGMSFEPLAHIFIRGYGKRKKRASLFSHFQPMKQTKATTEWPYRFVHNPSDTINTDATSNVLLFTSISPNIRMDILFYDDVETIRLVTQQLYCTNQTNNPVFDSFFFECSDGGVILWVFQMTITRTHNAKESGFHNLEKLKKRMASKFGEPVIVKFVLVIEYTEQQVMWNLLKNLKDFGDVDDGDVVYVLCLKV